MQPSPMAVTSRLLFPSLRFCLVSPSMNADHSSGRRQVHHHHASLLVFQYYPVTPRFVAHLDELLA
jgi:hypothetical protein